MELERRQVVGGFERRYGDVVHYCDSLEGVARLNLVYSDPLWTQVWFVGWRVYACTMFYAGGQLLRHLRGGSRSWHGLDWGGFRLN
jgi:hypothetical protein